jgi:hypothetical protein
LPSSALRAVIVAKCRFEAHLTGLTTNQENHSSSGTSCRCMQSPKFGSTDSCQSKIFALNNAEDQSFVFSGQTWQVGCRVFKQKKCGDPRLGLTSEERDKIIAHVYSAKIDFCSRRVFSPLLSSHALISSIAGARVRTFRALLKWCVVGSIKRPIKSGAEIEHVRFRRNARQGQHENRALGCREKS